MATKINLDQVNQIVNNLHHDPFEILGSHPIEEEGKVTSWVVRAYLPKATEAYVISPENRKEYKMVSLHHPQFF